MQVMLNIIKFCFKNFNKFKIFYFIIIGFFGINFPIMFCDDIIDDDNKPWIKHSDDDDDTWFTAQEREDFKIAFQVFKNVLKILIFCFSLAGFTVLLLACILVFDIANAHNYKRPTE